LSPTRNRQFASSLDLTLPLCRSRCATALIDRTARSPRSALPTLATPSPS